MVRRLASYPKASFSCPAIALYHIFGRGWEMDRWVLNHRERKRFISCSWFSSDLGHLLESWPYSIISALIPSASCGQSKPNDLYDVSHRSLICSP